MALPKLNTPTYKIKLESIDEEVVYRPFLVREEKILLTAIESDESQEIVNAVKQIITNCIIQPELDVDKLPSFDLELVFLNIRSRSVGDSIDLAVQHPNLINVDGIECNHSQEINISISDIKIVKIENHSKTIPLTDTVGVVMKYPTLAQTLNVDATSTKGIFEVIVNCIDSIYDETNVYDASTTTRAEMEEFIYSLNQQQFGKLIEFYQNMPKVKYETSYNCDQCKTDQLVTLQGMQSFFG